MGREVRQVPSDWKHPKRSDGRYIPMFEQSYSDALKEYEKDVKTDPEAWRPTLDGYMPDWSDEERTHFQMYEDTSEGTPISPVMETPEALARWLVDNGASSFAGQTASYEGWLRVARGGFAPSAVFTASTGMMSGVDALKDHKE